MSKTRVAALVIQWLDIQEQALSILYAVDRTIVILGHLSTVALNSQLASHFFTQT